MSTQTRTIMIDVWTEKPISQGQIALAIDYFRRENVDRPDQLVLGYDARRDLYKELDDMGGYTLSTTLDSYMGLRLKEDDNLLPHEWRVRLSNSKTDKLKDIT